MGIVMLVILCLLGLYVFLAGAIVWACLSDGEITPLSYFRCINCEDLHKITYGWAPCFKECISNWWIDVSIWMSDTLNSLGIVIVFVFLLLAFIGFLIEWIAVMIFQIPFVLIYLVLELFVKASRLLFCKK